MKLIDEKGRLFGKLNIIDLVVVVLILFLAAAVGYKVVSPKVATSPTAQGEVTAVVKCTFRSDSVVNSIKVGQQLVYGTDFIPDAYITDVKSNPADYVTTDSQGKIHIEKHPVLKDIYVTIKVKTNTNAPILKVGTQDLCEGKKFTLKTQTTEIDGSVENLTITGK